MNKNDIEKEIEDIEKKRSKLLSINDQYAYFTGQLSILRQLLN